MRPSVDMVAGNLWVLAGWFKLRARVVSRLVARDKGCEGVKE